jgi:hypothetical protein
MKTLGLCFLLVPVILIPGAPDTARGTQAKGGYRSPRRSCRRRYVAPGDSRVAGRVAYIRSRL